jgi:hypothetical protein
MTAIIYFQNKTKTKNKMTESVQVNGHQIEILSVFGVEKKPLNTMVM